MGMSMRVSLPLIFPGLLMISTLQIMVAVSGREYGVAAGALFSTVILPFLFAGYYLARDREEIKWVHDVLSIFGFYPFVYAVRRPPIPAFGRFDHLIPALSARYYMSKDNQINSIVFALSLLACLGIPDKSLIVIGLILLFLAFYTFREKPELQYIASYVILWTFVNQVYKVDYLVLSMGFIFGFAVFVMTYCITKRTPAYQRRKTMSL